VKCQTTRRGGLVCKRQPIERNSIQATQQHKIWLMWTTTCLFTLSKVSKL